MGITTLRVSSDREEGLRRSSEMKGVVAVCSKNVQKSVVKIKPFSYFLLKCSNSRRCNSSTGGNRKPTC